MILFLVYHKLRSSRGTGAEEFYTVLPAQLEDHLATLQTGGWRPIHPADLSAARLPAEPCYVITFDDGTSDHVELVLPLLQRYRCPAIFFVPTAKLNRPGQLTAGQLRDLAAAGQVVGSHGHEHRRLDRLRDGDIRAQLGASRRILADRLGVEPECFAPPGGYMDERVRAIALETGLRVIRTLRWGYNQLLDLTRIEAFSPNRFTTAAAFGCLLAPRRQGLAYASKQMGKWILPEQSYQWLRGRALALAARSRQDTPA